MDVPAATSSRDIVAVGGFSCDTLRSLRIGVSFSDALRDRGTDRILLLPGSDFTCMPSGHASGTDVEPAWSTAWLCFDPSACRVVLRLTFGSLCRPHVCAECAPTVHAAHGALVCGDAPGATASVLCRRVCDTLLVLFLIWPLAASCADDDRTFGSSYVTSG